MTSQNYTPSDWFWIVAGGDARVYSSAAAAYLSGDDGAYTNWLAAGNRPTNIASEAELWDVLQAHYPAGMPVTPDLIMAQIVSATQARLDAFAAERGYDGILSACTYASSSVPKFASEAQACIDLRDATWAALYGVLAEVQAGARPLPSGLSDIEADLPTLEWTP